MLSDQELLANLAHGRKPGFTMLYKKYSDSLFRYALMVSGSRSIAEEATQDTFIYMIEHPRAFDAERSPSALGWLYGILRNRVRALAREHSRSSVIFGQETYGPSPERSFELSGAVEALANAIANLSIDQREVIVLCGLQELDYAAAAEILRVPVGTIRSRLSRARRSLGLALSDAVGFTFEEIRNGI